MGRRSAQERHGPRQQFVPDGRLCSAGIDDLRGLDLPRDDWPSTVVRAGAEFTFRYRATIPHSGRFELYLTKDGYDPLHPLTWSHLEARLFLTVADPPLTQGAYAFDRRMPSGRTGRHVLYTVWRNTELRDTYYACSDVVFQEDTAAAGATPASPASGLAAPTSSAPAASPSALRLSARHHRRRPAARLRPSGPGRGR
ncbi:lytic polysaccharide monooxygenase [Streptomyces flaveolus]|uniref:lytic polysaccharide monooxygenase n=1 Tax=Streptomyces flaveolus TaxID=67297 RepID=UPI0033C2749D